MNPRSENTILHKLDGFIRKYYQNQLIRGVIFFLGLIAFAFLSVTLLEYYGRYTTRVRAFLFFSLLILAIGLFIWYIAIPLAHLVRFGKLISYEQAASIIGKHFKGVSDKLVNTLQLMQQEEGAVLLQAAIEQKTNELKPIPFTAAINFKANLSYLKYAIVPFIILVILLIFSPNVVSDSAKRIIQYDKAFKIPAPFEFIIENPRLETNQSEDFELKVKVEGKEIPNEVYIWFNNQTYRLQKSDPTHFTYLFRNPQDNISFHLKALSFEDDSRMLQILARPVLLNYTASLHYPPYLKIKDEQVINPGDLNLPAGTEVKWTFTGKQTSEIALLFSKISAKAQTSDNVRYTYSRKFFISDEYSILLKNEKVPKGDSLHFAIDVIPDAFPMIQMDETRDTLTGKIIYMVGTGSDDHGLTRLTFNYRFSKSDDKLKSAKGLQILNLPVDGEKNISINHIFNLFEINAVVNDEIEYFFELWDNDGVRGAKSTRSKLFVYKAPDKKELREQSASDSKALQNKMEEALSEAKELQRELSELQKKLKSQQPLTWEEKKRLESLLQNQKELQKKLEELQKDFNSKNQKEQAFKEEEERIVEKQKQLQKMYEELMNDEMKKIMKQLEEMLKLQNKDQIRKELDKMDISNKDVEKELDRMLEMYKEMEVDKRMEDAMKQLNDLAKRQRELISEDKRPQDKKQNNDSDKKDLIKENPDLKQTPRNDENSQKSTDPKDENEKGKEDGQKPAEELKQKQEELKSEFKDLQKELRDLEKKNQELEHPKDLSDTRESEKKVQDKMDKSSQELGKNNKKKADKEQEEAADELEKMEQEMRDKKDQEEEEQDELDAQALREILENLVQLSKDQESLMEDLKQINGYNPKFVELAQKQKQLRDNAKVIEDSLVSLSKTAPEIKSFVNREVTKMNSHLDKSNQGFSQRNIPEIRTQQQYGMTRMNNLAVMLSDALKQMQQDMQDKKQGKSKGKGKPSKKPGSGKPSMKQLKQMQEQMNKQLKEGMNKNGTGEKGKGQMSSEQYARMAAQQMAIRQQLQKMISEMDALEKEKMGGGKQLGDLQKLMEETEKELVNKRLTQETIMRQQEIITRLLEHERAEKKQEEEQRREAQQAKEIPKPSPQYLDMLNKKKSRDTELLHTVPPEMNPYYKQKSKEYLEGIE